MKEFIKGLDLSESFYNECALPLLREHYPDLRYSAGLIGWGSDVLGYDDEFSTDHNWGPRFYLFLEEGKLDLRPELLDCFRAKLPYEHRGYSVNFMIKENGEMCLESISEGNVYPMIFVHTLSEYLSQQFGVEDLSDFSRFSPLDWLSYSEQSLLTLVSGKFYHDGLGLERKLDAIRFYPENVRLYLIASQWSIIGEEEAFVKRCSQVGDELGSRIVCTRIAERLMRLCFLYKNKYAPYSKWFGTAFRQLSLDNIHDEITAALSANTIAEREDHILNAQILVVELHNTTGITEPFKIIIDDYGRNAKIIHTENFAEMVKDKITDPELKCCPLIGSTSQIGNIESLWNHLRKNINS